MMIGTAAAAEMGVASYGPEPMVGVTMTRADPLPAGPLAMAVLPDLVDMAILTAVPGTGEEFIADIAQFGRAAAGWQVRRMGLGYARIDLDGYRLTIDDIRAELILDNLTSGQSSRIWGSARFEVRDTVLSPVLEETSSGAGDPIAIAAPPMTTREIGQFWGTTSLELDNGLFITCGTAAMPDNANLFQLERLTITRGLDALVVSAIGGEAGDMAIEGTGTGYMTDVEVDDGLVLAEAGGRWLTEDYTAAADADYLAQTMPGAAYGPGENVWSLREFGRVMISFVDVVISGTTSRAVDTVRNHAADTVRHDDDRAAVIRAEHRRAALINAVFSGRAAPNAGERLST